MKIAKRLSIDISVSSIFWILLTCGGIYLLFMLSDILVLTVTSLLIALSVTPFVDKLEKFKISRSLSSAIILVLLFAVLVLFGISIATPLIEQTSVFIEKFPAIVEAVSPVKLDMNSFNSQIAQIPAKVFNIAIGTFSGLLNAFTTIILSFYIIQEMKRLPEYINFWFNEKSKIYQELSEKLQQQISLWVRGQLLLMLVVGILSYVGYLIIGIPYALPLAFIAGILELIPNIGPTIAAVPAILVGFSISPVMGTAALVVSLVVQQLENNFIVPKIMQKVAGLNPIITILVIMVGFRLGGPLLAILSIPILLSFRVVYSHIRLNHTTKLPEID
jgi:predicted PurR-regulated permease PerM